MYAFIEADQNVRKKKKHEEYANIAKGCDKCVSKR